MLHGSIPPVSCFPPAKPECSKHSNEVKPSQQTCHILLCSYSAGDGQDVLDAWHSLDWQRYSRCEITHFIFSDDRDLLDIMILLDQVRHGFFSSVYPTWSRSRNSAVPRQLPLRSRQCPLGLTALSPESRSKVRASNFSPEVAAWFAEQILRSPQLPTFFLLVFPEDFGGDSRTGPASPWSAREFTDLSDAVKAQRGAVYLCRFAGTDKRTSLGLGHVPRLALLQHSGQRVTIRGSSSGFLRMLHNTSVSTRTCGEKRFQILACPDARSTVLGPHPQQEARLSTSLFP